MTQTIKSPDYRPNSQRAIYLTSVIDQLAAEAIVRQGLPILGTSCDPITLFIDSPGGGTLFSERIYQTLKLPNQDSGERCRLITVGVNLAASAACDLLIAGDYALVYPHTVLLCHGVRQSGEGLDVTREAALSIAQSLASSNEQFALQLAENAISRFIFRFVTLRHTFESIRRDRANDTLSDASAFLYALTPHVSPRLMHLLRQAMINYLDNDLIDFAIREKIANAVPTTPASQVEFEALILECIIEYQRKDAVGDTDWTFRYNGIPQLESKFSLLMSSHEEAHVQQIEKLVQRWGEFLLSEDDSKLYSALLQDDRADWLTEKVTRTVRSLWFLFVGICRLLQENDNYISAEEAYWIGLIDEVIGRPELPNPRTLVEFAQQMQADAVKSE
jgi:ATP-dependent protease ClpP protease subunit